jgi:hypothetical protein
MQETVVDEEFQKMGFATVSEIGHWSDTDPRGQCMTTEGFAEQFTCNPVTLTCMIKRKGKKCPFCTDNTCGGPNDSYYFQNLVCSGDDDGDATPRVLNRSLRAKQHDADSVIIVGNIAERGDEEFIIDLTSVAMKRLQSASPSYTTTQLLVSKRTFGTGLNLITVYPRGLLTMRVITESMITKTKQTAEIQTL